MAPSDPELDSASTFRVHLLDMGSSKYGDAILIEFGEQRILIDGGHSVDATEDGADIPAQLEDLLGEEPPFRIDLLVVTHCHSDHIGCLPRLVEDGVLDVRHALLADPELGYPDPRALAPDAEGADVGPLPDAAEAAIAALGEEDLSGLREEELAAAIDAAGWLKTAYVGLVESLVRKVGKNKARLYGREFGPDAANSFLRKLFPDAEVRVLGPTVEHLVQCAQAIAREEAPARRRARDLMRRDAAISAVELFRQLASQPTASESDLAVTDSGRNQASPARNDQSIVLLIEFQGHRILLTGDMQFVEAQVTGLDDAVAGLLQETARHAPYSFVKAAHHGSDNSFGLKVVEALGKTRYYAVSTGVAPSDHPDRHVREELGGLLGKKIRWARTDVNGRITVSLLANGRVRYTLGRGKLDDTRPNPGLKRSPRDQGEAPPPEAGERVVSSFSQMTPDGTVEILARIPHVRTRVTLTVDVAPGEEAAAPAAARRLSTPSPRPSPRPEGSSTSQHLGKGRNLPPLLFVLPPADLLNLRLGTKEAGEVRGMIDRAGQESVVLSRADLSFEEARAEVLQRVRKETQGVVLVGGFDLVPSERVDLLEPDFRASLPRTETGDPFDPDDFVIWTDDGYGDTVEGGLPELPVSRIPDGHLGELVLSALAAGARPTRPERRGGMANALRPYAQEIFQYVPGTGDLLISEPSLAADVPLDLSAADLQYFLLHGHYTAPHRYTGEKRAGGVVRAFEVGNVGEARDAVVFSACCYAGLSVRTPALFWQPGRPLASFPAAESIALSYLRAGARSFIGATGVHWSPPMNGDPMQAGAPLHILFLGYLLDPRKGALPPAEALRRAKLEYSDRRPWFREEDERSLLDEAIELKHVFQFTCLGLGW